VKFYLISIITLMSCSFSFGQINLINPSKAGVEILPEGIRGGFIGKTTDSSNIALGKDALLNNTLSNRNIAIGIGALKLFNAPDNDLNTSMIAIGHGSLAKYNTTGTNLSIAIGKNALGNITQDALNNIVIGHFSSQNNRGDGKIVIGNRALTSGGTDTDGGIYIGHSVASIAPGSGFGNVVIGTRAMFNGGLHNNTIIGEEAGYGISTTNNLGIGNVMLGFKAGRNATGDQKLYIENSDSTNTLIGGNFRLNRVGINRANALIESANRTLQVEGSTLITDVLQLPLGAGSGKILTSDAQGNASWQNAATSGLWQQVGNFIQNTNPNGFWSSYGAALPTNATNTTSPPVAPVEGNGTRMAWIPSRSAFQGGTFNLADGSVRFVSDSIGLFSFCYGLNSRSRARNGVAFGEGAIADGTSNTLAFGENIRSGGENSLLGGFESNISDGTSNTILFGENSEVTNGQYNHGMGWGLGISGFGTSNFGTFNTSIASSNTSWISTDPLFVLGNGSSNTLRSNAMVIQKNGVVNIGTTPNTSTTYKLRVSGSISSTSTVQALNLRASSLAGTDIRDVCTDANGNLIECPGGGIGTNTHNVSAMGFHPQTSSTAAAAGFQRDIVNGFVSYINNTKQTEAYLYAPVELPDGFTLNQMAFHYKQAIGGSMTVSFKKVQKINAGPAVSIVSITTSSGAGVLESFGTPSNTEVINNSQFYYFLYVEGGSTWQGQSMAVRGVMFSPEKVN
jgi:trimeric autotransporter adhesin